MQSTKMRPLRIVPNGYGADVILATSPINALVTFAGSMSLDMGDYFHAESCPEGQNEYSFRVSFGEGRYADGLFVTTADSEDEACDHALSEICDRLNMVLPELDIEVSVELVED